jgi:HEAT repeat protein
MGLFDRFKKERAGAESAGVEVSVLVLKLGDPDWKQRLDAARRLGALGAGAASAQAALEEATSDESGEVCTAAADALASIRRALHA